MTDYSFYSFTSTQCNQWINDAGDLTSGQIAVLVIAVLVVVWLWLTSLVIVLVCRYYDNVALKQQLHQLKLLVASGDKLAQQQEQWQWQEIKAWIYTAQKHDLLQNVESVFPLDVDLGLIER